MTGIIEELLKFFPKPFKIETQNEPTTWWYAVLKASCHFFEVYWRYKAILAAITWLGSL